MGRKRTPGLRLRHGVWHIEKRICRVPVFESTGSSSLEEAEKYLARRSEQVRLAQIYGVAPTRLWREAAAKYLEDGQHKASITDDAIHLDLLDAHIGHLPINAIHDEPLKPFVKARLADGCKHRTINYALGIVRHILRLAARKWRDQDGRNWIDKAPLLTMLPLTDSRSPYPLSWEEQALFFSMLPRHLEQMALFKVNTGTREQEVCQLRWEWEVDVPELNTSVFVIPGSRVKNREDRLVVMNEVARSVIDSVRDKHETYVFTYEDQPIVRMNNSAWRRARVKAAIRYEKENDTPCPLGLRNLRVHDLKHTIGRRLRAARVPLETRKVLLGHKNGDITTHYSAPELHELLEATNKICGPQSGKIPAVVLVKRQAAQILRSEP